MRADVVLVGFGNVGRRFVRVLEERRDTLARDFDLECRIVGIATRRHGCTFSPDGVDAMAAARTIESDGRLEGAVADSFDLIRRVASLSSEVRVVVETTTLQIDDAQPAVDHVRAALSSGCHVVTANKGPVAFAYEELQSQARAAGLQFLFEGAVMDGVPIFNLVRDTLPAVRIDAFRGVVNSTTNHILTALEDGEAFAPALARMQADGIAEADPSLDLDGWDAAAKAAALANVWLDAGITPKDVARTGVGPATAARAIAARESGRRLRLVASARRGERPRVNLEELTPEDLLAGLRGVSNALTIETDLLGRIAITQLDGGLTQTAFALVSDLVGLRRSLRARHEAPARRSL